MRSEKAIQTEMQISFPYCGGKIWRNNVGAFYDGQGRLVRYGLGNESKKVNEENKSSDLIGITPVTVTQGMVGQKVGIFTAIECKREGWEYTDTKAERAQKNFLELVKSLGGRAKFYAGVDIHV